MSLSPKPRQFTLRQLLLFVTGFALLCAAAGSAWYLFTRELERDRLSICEGRMEQSGLAAQEHFQHRRHFPPAYSCDAAGKPVWSWRLWLLPYLESTGTFEEVDRTAPWDGPANRVISATSIAVYQCPSGLNERTTMTDYVAVVGENTMWPGARCIRLKGPRAQTRVIPDPRGDKVPPTYVIDFGSLGDKMWIVEMADSDINWMEPRDPSLEEVLAGAQPGAKPVIASHHPEGAVCLRVDGSVQVLSRDVDPRVLRQMLTIDPNDPSVERCQPVWPK